MNKNGALAGMLVGGLTTIIWYSLKGGIFSTIYELLPGFFLATLAIVIVSKLTGGANQEIKDEFGKVEEILNTK